MFYCQSELASKRWLSLDLAGVSVGMCGCYFPGAYYAFYCDVVTLYNDKYVFLVSDIILYCRCTMYVYIIHTE